MVPSKNSFDVAIIGSGPAGSSAALPLAKMGRSVLVLEKAKLPRYKTCGGGVVHRAVKYLPMSIQDVIEANCKKVAFHLLQSNLHFEAVRENPVIVMTMRDRLDHLLISEAAKAGAQITSECEVLNVQQNSDSLVLETNRGSFESRFLIAADGALGIVAPKCGWQESRYLIPALECEVYVDDKTLERFSVIARFDFEVISDGYAWVFPKKDHLSIGVLSMKRGNSKLTHFLNRYFELLGITETLKTEQHGYVIPVSPRKDDFMKGRVLLVGDVAGFADPITAEGISFAILSGQIAAQALLKEDFKEKPVKQIYEKEIRSRILRELKIGKFLAKLLYNYPKTRRILFRSYGNQLTKAMTQVFMGESTYAEIIRNPANYLKLVSCNA